MRHFASIAALALALPQITLAAAPTTMTDLYDVLKNQKGTYTFSAEAHARMPGVFYASLWMSGESTIIDDPMDPVAKLKLTLDVADDTSNVRVRARMQMKDQTVYGIVDSIDGNFPNEIDDLQDDLQVGTWYALHMPPTAEMQEQQKAQEDELLPLLEEWLDVSRTESTTQTEYSLKLKEAVMDQLRMGLVAAEAMAHGYVDEEGKSMRTGAPNPSLDFHVRLALDPSNTLLFLKHYIAASDEPMFSIVFQGEQKQSDMPVTVDVPSDVIDLTVPTVPAAAEGTTTSSTPITDDDCNSPKRVSLIRQGYCQELLPPSRRR